MDRQERDLWALQVERIRDLVDDAEDKLMGVEGIGLTELGEIRASLTELMSQINRSV